MTEILIIAAINCICVIAMMVLQYVAYIRNRKTFDRRIQQLQKGKSGFTINPFIYFPATWQKKLQTSTLFQKKKGNANTGILKQVTPQHFLLINICIGFISYNLQSIIRVPWYISFLLLILLEAVAYWYLKGKQILVKEAIEKKLPEILDMMARVYRVHTDLRVAVKEVSNHTSDEIVKNEFKHVAQLSQFGYSVEDSLDHLAKSTQSRDLDFVVSSIKLNAPVGGNLSHLFDHTAQMLRQRKEATDEINNLMFQSKISSIVSALLVPVIILVSFISSQKYQDALLKNPTGRMVFFFCLIWWFIGVIIIRKNSRVSL